MGAALSVGDMLVNKKQGVRARNCLVCYGVITIWCYYIARNCLVCYGVIRYGVSISHVTA